MKLYSMLALFLLWAFVGGCDTSSFSAGPDSNYVKPTVAVMKFENRCSFPLGWDLGDGMADVLVDRLVETGRYHVVERPALRKVLDELRLQQGDVTRPQGRAQSGRIMNVQYLIKGTVTDFGHVASASGFLGMQSWAIFGGGDKAVMGITMYVVEVESGKIVACESIEESVSAKDLNVKGTYQGTSFGGQAFYQTPLGRATRRVIDKAVARISKTIARQPWEPKIAQVSADGTVVLNGGVDREMKTGQQLEVLQTGAPVLDPDNGDVIGYSGGQTLGRVQVVTVGPRYSIAKPTTAMTKPLEVGQRCKKL